MNIFRKSQGFGFHISRFLCLTLAFSIALIGFPLVNGGGGAQNAPNISSDESHSPTPAAYAGPVLGTALLIGLVPALGVIGIATLSGCSPASSNSGGGSSTTGGCSSGWSDCENGRCCPGDSPLWCNGYCYKVAGSSPCGVSGEIVCHK